MASWASVLVLVAVIAAALPCAWLLGRGQAVPAERMAGLEGLRGVLALCVLAHHLLLTRNLVVDGAWGGIADNLGNVLGKGAVAMFFMLSAFLFTGRIATHGGDVPAGAFLAARARRILPGWCAAIALLFGIVALDSGFRLHEPVAQVLREAATWIAFPDVRPIDINGRVQTFTIFSASYSLRYEWLFYLALPLLAGAHRRFGRYAPLVLLGVPALLFNNWPPFLLGALAVPLAERTRLPWGALGAAGLALLVATQHHPGSWMTSLLLFPAFMGVVTGARGFARLGSTAFARLGRTSYGVYLYHNQIVYLVLTYGVGAAWLNKLDTIGLAVLAGIVTLVVLCVAEASWRWIERPFLEQRDQLHRASNGERARSIAATITKERTSWPISVQFRNIWKSSARTACMSARSTRSKATASS